MEADLHTQPWKLSCKPALFRSEVMTDGEKGLLGVEAAVHLAPNSEILGKAFWPSSVPLSCPNLQIFTFHVEAAWWLLSWASNLS